MQQKQEVLLDISLVEPSYEKTTYQLKDLNKELLVLRLAFGQMKKAISDAFAPVASVVLPFITNAIRGVTRLANTFAGVISGLLGVQIAQNKVKKTVLSTGKAVKRTVASFDHLNRLQGASGGAKYATQTVTVPQNISQKAEQIAEKIRGLLAPFADLNLRDLRWEFERLKDAMAALFRDCGPILQELWQQVLVPFIAWVITEFAPVFLETVAEAIRLVHATILALGDGFFDFWQRAKPVVAFLGETAKTAFSEIGQLFGRLREAVCSGAIPIRDTFYKMGVDLEYLWNNSAPTLAEMKEGFATAFRSIDDVVIGACTTLLNSLRTAMQAVGSLLAENFRGIWDTVANVCKGAINGILGFLNGMLTGFTEAVNGVSKLLNKLKVTVPDWVPEFGGKTFGFSLKTVTAPAIPYLAKGAVLPANKPFLAMVGDQKHGTNIEAPLATIQEAVALVLDDQIGALQAGFSATVRELQQLRAQVGGIQVGDAVIGRAANRYNEKMTLLQGSY